MHSTSTFLFMRKKRKPFFHKYNQPNYSPQVLSEPGA